jgi:hypothetical protein
MNKDNVAYEPPFKPLWTAGEPPMNLCMAPYQKGLGVSAKDEPWCD